MNVTSIDTRKQFRETRNMYALLFGSDLQVVSRYLLVASLNTECAEVMQVPFTVMCLVSFLAVFSLSIYPSEIAACPQIGKQLLHTCKSGDERKCEVLFLYNSCAKCHSHWNIFHTANLRAPACHRSNPIQSNSTAHRLRNRSLLFFNPFDTLCIYRMTIGLFLSLSLIWGCFNSEIRFP